MLPHSISKYKSLFTSVSLAICSTSLMATDTYDPATNQLSIPSVKVGSATYSNVVVTVGSVISVGGVSSTQSAEGLWSGTTSSGFEVNSLILENNEFWNIVGRTMGNVFYIVAFDYGAAAINDNSYSTFYKEYTANSTSLGYSTGTVTTNSKISGTVTTVGATTQSSTISMTPANSSFYNYNRNADLNELAGSWTGSFLSGPTGTIQIASNGQFSVRDSTGCNSSGTITPRSSGKNVFNLSTVDGVGCPNPGFKTTGIVITYLTNTGKRQLIAGATNESKSGGDAFTSVR